MRMSFNVPAWGQGTRQLDALVTLGRLKLVRGVPVGCTGNSYRAVGQIGVAGLWTMTVDDVRVTADIYRMPSAMLRALVGGAQLYDTADLETQLEAGSVKGWWPQVLEVVSSGPAGGRSVKAGPLTQAVEWRPDETRLTRHAAGWTVTYTFEVETSLDACRHDQVVGVDVGVFPLATARAPGLALTVPGVWIPNADKHGPSLPLDVAFAVRQVSRSLVYGVARRRWEGLIANVLPQASIVGVEDLESSSLKRDFRRLCTDVAIQDVLMAWLPQLAREAGVRLVRVDPALTSCTCSKCVRWAERADAHLTCEKHGQLNVHSESAELVRILTIAQVLRERQAQAADRRRR